MRVVGYVRVSTSEQAAEGVSLAAQEAKLRASGLSLREVARHLAEEGHQTKRGGAWAAATVRLVLRREGVA